MGRRKKYKSNYAPANNHSAENAEKKPKETSTNDNTYRVETSEILRRYLTANRDLKAGEVIMVDEKIVIGPCEDSKPMCIGCFTNIDFNQQETFIRCPKCTLPLCSLQCPGSHFGAVAKGSFVCHTKEECDFIEKSSLKKVNTSELKHCFYAITPLRLLMIKILNPSIWKIIEDMEAHTEIRKGNENLWKENEEMAVKKIHNSFGLIQFTSDEIHFVCGVLEVNSFEVNILGNPQPLRAIYPKACLFAHDCVPNTSHSIGQGFSLIVRTTQPVTKNSILTVSYTYTLQSTLNRRKHLLDTKFFLCSCRRCSDVTEFGVYCSAVMCPSCRSGRVLPGNPLDMKSEWVCELRNCRNKIPPSMVTVMCQRISSELDSISGNDIEGYENFLKKYSNTLYENHYLSLSALHSLSQLYGKVNGYIINELTEEQLERKIEICKKLIKIFDKLQPGLSKQRGVLLYELQASLMTKLRRQFEQNITKKELKQKVREVNKCLEECCQILSTEQKCTSEGIIAGAAKEALESMKNWESVIGLL